MKTHVIQIPDPVPAGGIGTNVSFTIQGFARYKISSLFAVLNNPGVVAAAVFVRIAQGGTIIWQSKPLDCGVATSLQASWAIGTQLVVAGGNSPLLVQAPLPEIEFDEDDEVTISIVKDAGAGNTTINSAVLTISGITKLAAKHTKKVLVE